MRRLQACPSPSSLPYVGGGERRLSQHGRAQVDRFQGLMQELDPEFVWPDLRTIEVAREELPEKLTVMVLGGNGGD